MLHSNALWEARRENGVLVAAHRGVSGGNIPCNTLPAFEGALRQGAHILEADLTVSRDGEVFIFHPGQEMRRRSGFCVTSIWTTPPRPTG